MTTYKLSDLLVTIGPRAELKHIPGAILGSQEDFVASADGHKLYIALESRPDAIYEFLMRQALEELISEYVEDPSKDPPLWNAVFLRYSIIYGRLGFPETSLTDKISRAFKVSWESIAYIIASEGDIGDTEAQEIIEGNLGY